MTEDEDNSKPTSEAEMGARDGARDGEIE